jgi:Bacterial regulatory proteins, luxR family
MSDIRTAAVGATRSFGEPTITLAAKAWLTSLSCRKAKELGYPHECGPRGCLAAMLAVASDRIAELGRVPQPARNGDPAPLASGMRSCSVAELLNLSEKTIRNHHYSIKSKIGAKNDAHLVWLAISSGLVSIADACFDVDHA